MAVRTLELGHANIAATGTTNLYTCPANKTAIVKDIRCFKRSTASATVDLEVVRSAVAYGVHQFSFGTGVSSQAIVGSFIVLEPGDTLRVITAGTLPSINVWASGAQLDGVA